MRFQRPTLFNPFGFPRGLHAAVAALVWGALLVFMGGVTVYEVVSGAPKLDLVLAFMLAAVGAILLFVGLRKWPR